MGLIILGGSDALTISQQQNIVYGVGPNVTVNHNLGYIPFVKIIDTDTGQEDIATVTHNNVNSFIVSVIGVINLTIKYL